jgi:hypothetical protein
MTLRPVDIHPLALRELHRQRYRWMRVKRFPYLLYYEIRDPQPVLIYAIAHGRRRPAYWMRRKPP